MVGVGDTEATSPGSNAGKSDDTHAVVVVVGFAKVDTAATNAVNTSLAVPVAACGVAQEEVVVADTAVKLVGRRTKHDTAVNNVVVVA